MDDRAITSLLDELHAKLRNATTVSADDREALAKLAADIQALPAGPGGPAAAAQRSVTDRLQESITRFEVTHPSLTDVMARVVQALADMGI